MRSTPDAAEPRADRAADPAERIPDAITVLAERGYDATTVDQLADALAISRSTFFRRYGSKDDVVFADHEYLLGRLAERLASGDPLTAVADAAALVLEHHLRRPDVALQRHALLQSNPALRDRELVTSHRYERLFRDRLRAALPDAPGWAITAYASGVVAVHNAVLRAWFRDPATPAAVELQAQLRRLTAVFAPVLTGRPAASRVIVTVHDHDADTDTVLSAIGAALSA